MRVVILSAAKNLGALGAGQAAGVSPPARDRPMARPTMQAQDPSTALASLAPLRMTDGVHS
jgi:hypothetical protein